MFVVFQLTFLFWMENSTACAFLYINFWWLMYIFELHEVYVFSVPVGPSGVQAASFCNKKMFVYLLMSVQM